MKKSWSFTDNNGMQHNIEYKSGLGMKLIVDGNKYKLKSQNWFIVILDYSIEIAGTDIRLVAIGNKVDVAINGVYIGSGEPYVPIQANTPAWVWVLVGISTIGGYFISGLPAILIGILMSTVYVKNALKKKTGMVIGCFIACTLLQVILMFVLAGLLNAIGYYDYMYY